MIFAVGTAQDQQVFAAVADPTRRRVLLELAERPRSVHELVALHGCTQPAMSQHLRRLRDADLVDVEQDGRRRLYSVRAGGLDPLRAWLDDLDRFWESRLAALGRWLSDQEEDR